MIHTNVFLWLIYILTKFITIYLLYLGIVPSLSKNVTLPSYAPINDHDVPELTDKQKILKFNLIIYLIILLLILLHNCSSAFKITNDQHIKNFDARVVVSSDQKLFKFENLILI